MEKKNKSSSQSSGKFYVVFKGRTIEICNSWEKCAPHVLGFQGAIYSSYQSEIEVVRAHKTYFGSPDKSESDFHGNWPDEDKGNGDDGSYVGGNPPRFPCMHEHLNHKILKFFFVCCMFAYTYGMIVAICSVYFMY